MLHSYLLDSIGIYNEGVKLEQVISQNDIKVNNHNVGMLNDVVNNLKKEVYAMREKLDKHVVGRLPWHENVTIKRISLSMSWN